MRKGILSREESSDEGTFGTLTLDSGFMCKTVELPWRGNMKGKSCIPEGVYRFRIVNSPKHGACYEMWDDPATPQDDSAKGRTHIQIHSANWAGDAEKGWVCQLEGCIAPGWNVESMMTPNGKKQKGVVSSKATVQALTADLRGEPFELTIVSRIPQ